MKKNAILTFCFACIPGTGAMYVGYMKRGLSQLALFCATLTLVSMFYLEPFMFMLPLLFAYCFFDTWNLRNQTPEQAAANPDAYIIHAEQLGGENVKALMEKRHTLIGWGCIVIAGLLLYNNVFMRLVWRYDDYLPSFVGFVLNTIPSLAVIAGLIFLGLYLLRGPRMAQFPASHNNQDEYVAYTGAQSAQAPLTPLAPQVPVAPPVPAAVAPAVAVTPAVAIVSEPELVWAAPLPSELATEATQPALELEAPVPQTDENELKAEGAIV